jgi:hypothetical protein
MDNGSIISVVSICVTLILGIAGYVFNSFVQRKNNSIEIITKSRIARRDKLQEISRDLLELTDIDYLNYKAKNDWGNYVEQITRACAELRTLLEFEFKHDVLFVNSAYELKRTVMSFNLEFNAEEYKAARKDFQTNMDVYTASEWKRIKLETVGKQGKNKRGINWDKIYSDNLNKYESTVSEIKPKS